MNYPNQPQSKSYWLCRIFNTLLITLALIAINFLSENPAIKSDFLPPILELNFETN